MQDSFLGRDNKPSTNYGALAGPATERLSEPSVGKRGFEMPACTHLSVSIVFSTLACSS